MDSPPPKKRRQRECQQYRLEFCFVGPASQYSTFGARSSADMPGSGSAKNQAVRSEARVWLGDHAPPTLRDRAERSAVALERIPVTFERSLHAGGSSCILVG